MSKVQKTQEGTEANRKKYNDQLKKKSFTKKACSFLPMVNIKQAHRKHKRKKQQHTDTHTQNKQKAQQLSNLESTVVQVLQKAPKYRNIQKAL